jgi:predicted dehydrogenase
MTATDRPNLAWGILGTGNIARQFSVGVNACRRGRLASVASRDPAKAAAFAQTHNIPHHARSYEDLLADPSIDVIYVSLPNNLHHDWTIKALRAGKHVLCEKPFATSLARAQEMFEAARRAGKVLIEAFMYRAHPLTQAVIEAVNSGVIGNVRLIRTSFCFKVSKWQGNIRFDPGLDGGVLMDVGVYCTNFARLFAKSEPDRVHVFHRRHGSGVDDIIAGMLGFPNGVLASFSCGMTVHADNTASICGDEGYLEIPVPWKPPSKGATFTIARSTPPKMEGAGVKVPPPREIRTIGDVGELYALEADAFADTVLDGAPPFVTAEDTLGNQKVLDELRRQMSM